MNSEAAIEAYLVKRVRQLGGEVRKVKWLGRDSAPDRVVMLPGERVGETVLLRHPIWVEVKREGRAFPANAHERMQHREHERMRKMGQQVVVVSSKAGVDTLLSIEGAHYDD